LRIGVEFCGGMNLALLLALRSGDTGSSDERRMTAKERTSTTRATWRCGAERADTSHMFPRETSFRNSGFKYERRIYSTILHDLAQRQKRSEKLEREI